MTTVVLFFDKKQRPPLYDAVLKAFHINFQKSWAQFVNSEKIVDGVQSDFLRDMPVHRSNFLADETASAIVVPERDIQIFGFFAQTYVERLNVVGVIGLQVFLEYVEGGWTGLECVHLACQGSLGLTTVSGAGS